MADFFVRDMTTVEFANYTGGEVGDIITISDRQGCPAYLYTEDNGWVEMCPTENLIPSSKCITDVMDSPKIVYETLKVQGFSCPNCGSTEFEGIDNTKIRCKHCASMFNCKLE